MTYERLLEKIIEWNNRLNECQYAGEIYLEEPELLAIAEYLRANPYRFRDKETLSTLLLVIAVNCAYYYYDEQGFWKHFNELTGMDNTSQIGSVFEQKLRILGLLKVNRTGPFRYVGSILEQSGVSKRYIPSFANFLRDLKEKLGWNILASISNQEYINRVSEHYCAAYLKDFLLDPEGMKFTLQVGQLIRMYEDGVMSKMELESLSGFHPGFWTKILAHFTAKRSDRNYQENTGYYKPRIYLDIFKKVVGIKFPTPEYITGMADNAGFTYPSTLFDDVGMYKERYHGTINSSSGMEMKWEITGWQPSGLPVLFDKERCYLIDPNTTVDPGDYYILVPDGYAVPEQLILGKYGELNIPTRQEYSIYLIKINWGDHLQHINIPEKNDDYGPVISWGESDQNRFTYHNYFSDVFMGSIPEIEVSNFSPIENNIVGLFYEVSDGSGGRIRTQKDLRVVIENINSKLPVRGKFWTTLISRNRFYTQVRQLSFFLLPPLKLPFIKKTYGFHENVTINLNDNSDKYKIQLNNCRQANGNEALWVLERGEDSIEGEISAEDIRIGFSIPIFRFGFTDSAGKHIRYLVQNNERITLRGYPELDFVLLSDSSTILKGTFNSKGLWNSNALEVYDSVDETKGLTQLSLEVLNESVDTGCSIVKIRPLKRLCYESDIELHPNNNLMKVIRVIRSLIMEPSLPISLNIDPSFFPEFDEWMATMFACADIFDGNAVKVKGDSINWGKKIKDSVISEVLEACRENNTDKLNDENIHYVINSEVGTVLRWRKLLDASKSSNKTEQKWEDLKLWSDEIRKGSLTVFKSNLAQREGALMASQAWGSYLRGNTLEAIRRIGQYNGSEDTLSSSIKLLNATIMLRNARLSTAKSLLSAEWQQKTFDELRMYIFSCLTSQCHQYSYNSNDVESLISLLPLKTEDQHLYSFLIDKDSPTLVVDENEDWLILWFVFNRFVVDKISDAKKVAYRLLELEQRIPASPDKEAILDALQMSLRGN